MIILRDIQTFSTYDWKGQNNQAPPGLSQLIKLHSAAVSSRFLYKWKKPLRILPISFNFLFYSFSPPVSSSHVIPQDKILEYVTIQKQGPYLQQLHIKLSLFMYIGPLG